MIDRRRTPKPRLTINQILDYMQAIADDELGGNVQDHVLLIFSRLSPDDRKTYLRKTLRMLWEKQIEQAKAGESEVILDEELRINPDSVNEERKNIESKSYQEQAKLKMWFTKVFLGAAILIFGGLIGMSYYMDGSNANAEPLMRQIDKVTRLLF